MKTTSKLRVYIVLGVLRDVEPYKEKHLYHFNDEKVAYKCAKALRNVKKPGSGGKRFYSSCFVIDKLIHTQWPSPLKDFHY